MGESPPGAGRVPHDSRGTVRGCMGKGIERRACALSLSALCALALPRTSASGLDSRGLPHLRLVRILSGLCPDPG